MFLLCSFLFLFFLLWLDDFPSYNAYVLFFFFNLLYAFDLQLLCQICKPLHISTYLRLVVIVSIFWGKKSTFSYCLPPNFMILMSSFTSFFFLAVHCGYHFYTFSFFQICVLTYFPVMIFPFLCIFTSFLENFQYFL